MLDNSATSRKQNNSFFGTYSSRKDVLQRHLRDVGEKFNHKRLIDSFSGRHFRTFGKLLFETDQERLVSGRT